MSMMVIGAVGTTVGAGTFASFTASTANEAATFSTGSLVLSNTKPTATACLSSGADKVVGAGADEDGINAKNCDTLLDVDTMRLGDDVTVDVQLTNEGNLAGSLQTYAGSQCVSGKAPGPDGIVGTADDEPFDGLGDACGAIQLTIQQYTAGWDTPGTCVYGGPSCAFSTAHTLASFDDFTELAPLSFDSLTPGSSAYLRVGLRLMDGPDLQSFPIVSNTVQGRQATFDFTWRLES